jgi:hypothetical protein
LSVGFCTVDQTVIIDDLARRQLLQIRVFGGKL